MFNTPRPVLVTLYKLSQQELAWKFFSAIEILIFWILQISTLFLITKTEFNSLGPEPINAAEEN